MKPLIQIGIIGYGRFGKLMAQHLAKIGVLRIYDMKPIHRIPKRASVVSLASVIDTDILFLFVPISHMEQCCKEIASFLKPHTIIVDACSVKIYPVKCMQKLLPRHNAIIATHPLFGPDSAKRGIKGMKIVVCPIRASRSKQKRFKMVLDMLGLQQLQSTPQQHDRAMARSQALVHFIGRGLQSLRLQHQRIATPDYQSLLRMQDMVGNDTRQLFCDMQTYNPYTITIRKRFLKSLSVLNDELIK
ncbi:prephenate dehydrogenase [Candidatus Uhrbacteria bacterium]|nr:prephenate dehydrogenase [Candidatus Uhrbacteria bacterium]